MIQTKKIVTNERTSQENRYFHGAVINQIAASWKWKPSSVKKFIKKMYGIKYSADLSTIEFENWMENIRQHASRYWNINIGLPNL